MNARFWLPVLLFALPAAAQDVVPADSVEKHVNVRAAPAADAEVVGRLARGEALPHVASVPGWHEVRLDSGSSGFVSDEWTRVVEAPPETPAAEAAPAGSEAGEPGDAEAAPEPVAAAEPERVTAAGTGAAPEPEAKPGSAAPAEPEGTPAPDAEPEPAAALEEEAAPEPAAEDAAPSLVDADAESSAGPATSPDTGRDSAAQGTPAPEPAAAAPAVEPVPQETPPAADPASLKGSENFVVKFRRPDSGGNSQIWDDGNFVGIGTTEPKQKLEVNGSIQIHERHSSVAGLMITQSSGDTGYILHNRASTLTIGAGSVDRITIDRNGNTGFGVTRPSHPLEHANGAYLSAGGVWSNSSSRERKDDITSLTLEDALKALAALEPVEFRYRNDTERHVGFIAEEVPDLVANDDRESLSPMDIVAVLTRVVQAQERRIAELEARLAVASPD